MADYGIGRQGGSLRDALNELYPMTGLGEYGAMFPPNAGAPEPTAPVPLPQPRPQMPPQGMVPPQQGLPPGVPPPQGVPLPVARPPGLPQQLPPQSYTQRLGLG